MTFDTQVYARERLYDRNVDRVGARYRWALAQGNTRPVVLVMDPNDQIAHAIAETTGRGSEVTAHINLARRLGAPPALTWPLSGRLAEAMLAEAGMPEVAAEVAQTPPAEFAVVIAADGVTVVHVPAADVEAGSSPRAAIPAG